MLLKFHLNNNSESYNNKILIKIQYIVKVVQACTDEY